MTKTPKRTQRNAVGTSRRVVSSQSEFDEVVALIEAARGRALASVNTALIDLYWQIGEHISRQIAWSGWGQGAVKELAEYIHRRQPNARGFSAQNLWRMRQFYETYSTRPKLSPLVRELSWTHNLLIMSRALSPALVAEYQTRLPDKKLLQAKLHEFYASAEKQSLAPGQAGRPPVAQLLPPDGEPC